MSGGALSPGAFLAGAVLLAVTLGCSAGTARLAVARRAPQLTGAPQAVAVGMLTLAAVLVAHLVPLVLGALTRLTPPLAAAALLGAASRLRPRVGPGGHARPPGPPKSAPGSYLLAGVGVLATAAAWLSFLEVAATLHVTSVDALSFHLPGVISFIQTGTLWQTAQYIPGQAQGNYPQYGDLLLLALALPWHSLALVRYVDPLLLALAGLAVYALGRELRAPAPTAALAALALIAIRPALAPALGDVLTDPLFLAGFAAGALFLLRGELVLAGIGLGLALGTKWYGLTDVPALLLVWGLATRRPRALATVIAVTLVAGGIWLLRNLMLTGNPVFDYRVSLLGATLFAAPPDPIRARIGFTLAHYLPHPSVLRRYVWPVFRSDFGLTGALIVVGWLISARRAAVLAGAALLCALAYLVTPYSAQGFAGAPVLVAANTRYAMPALLLGAPLLAVAIGRTRHARPLLELVLLACIVAGLHKSLPAGAGRLVVNGGALLALVAVARLAARPALVAAAVAAALLAYHYQRVLAATPYSPPDATVEYVLHRAPAGARIALTGTWTAQGLVPVAPLFGPRLRNSVSYLGPFVEHRLEQYRSALGFDAALARGRYELLEIGTGFPPSPDPPALRWARAAGWRVVAASPRLILLAAGARP